MERRLLLGWSRSWRLENRRRQVIFLHSTHHSLWSVFNCRKWFIELHSHHTRCNIRTWNRSEASRGTPWWDRGEVLSLPSPLLPTSTRSSSQRFLYSSSQWKRILAYEENQDFQTPIQSPTAKHWAEVESRISLLDSTWQSSFHWAGSSFCYDRGLWQMMKLKFLNRMRFCKRGERSMGTRWVSSGSFLHTRREM